MSRPAARGPVEEAFSVLTDHCLACAVCRPDVDRPAAEAPLCAVAEGLRRAWSRARRADREGGGGAAIAACRDRHPAPPSSGARETDGT